MFRRGGEETLPGLVDTLLDETVIGVSCGDGQTIAVTARGVRPICLLLSPRLSHRITSLVQRAFKRILYILLLYIAGWDWIRVVQEVFGWGCYKDKEGKKWFHPSATGEGGE